MTIPLPTEITGYTKLFDKTKTAQQLEDIYKPHDETFDVFCKAMCGTELLTLDEKALIRRLLDQWEKNKER